MAPVNTMTSPTDISDDFRHDFESTFSGDAVEQLRELDKSLNIEASVYEGEQIVRSHPVINSETHGEPVTARDLFSSDAAYEVAEQAAREQLGRTTTLKNLGQRLAALRESR